MDPGGEEGRIGSISGAVLLGGASPPPGAESAARLLASLFQEVLWVGGAPPEGAPGRAVADEEGPPCALRGLASALGSAAGESVLVLGSDFGVGPDLVLALVAWPVAAAVVARSGEQAQPLCALYRRDAVLPVARARLAAGQLALHGLLDAVETSYLDASDLSAG